MCVCKPDTFKAFQFKSTAELTSDGAVFEMLVKTIEEEKIPVPPPKHAVTIKVEEVRALGES